MRAVCRAAFSPEFASLSIREQFEMLSAAVKPMKEALQQKGCRKKLAWTFEYDLVFHRYYLIAVGWI